MSPPNEPEEPAAAALVAGRYELLARVHDGGMARVDRACDRETGLQIAVKRPTRAEPESIARFLEEAAILSAISHPSVVRWLAHGGSNIDDTYLAMEWLDGQTLAARLSPGPLTLRDAATVTRCTAEALAAVHRAGVVHRDVKPANIMLGDASTARSKLLDFGIARRQSRPGLQVHASFAGGTWAYMSPEQLMGSAELGARTDIYSLGCVLFECIAGRPAFPSERADAAVAKIWQPPPQLSDYCRDVPSALLKLVAKMLAGDPALRPKDAQALLAELAALGELPDRVAAP